MFPDDKQQGQQYWGMGVTYSVTGNVPNYTNPAEWSNVTAYTTGQRVLYNSFIYKALVNSTNVIPGSDIITWQPENWSTGDNRNPMIVMYCVDITIYNLMPRIAPRAIPKVRIDAYEQALMWLQRVADGKTGPTLVPVQGNTGMRTRFGGNVKNINGY